MQARNPASAKAKLHAAILAGSVALMPAITPAIAVAQSYSFSNLKIEGAQRIEPATIITYAGIQRGAALSAGDVNDAVQRLQNSGLFQSVEAIPQGGTLVIRVVENPTINIINFEGNRKLKDDKLAEIVTSRARRVYSPAQAEADAAAIAKIYAESGRLAAQVTPKIIRRDGNRVDLVFEIAEGKVVENERISFTGNRAFSDRRLRQVLATKQAGLLRTFIQRDTLIPERLELDKKLLTDFYRSRGYIDFKVDAVAPEVARERDATFVTFSVQEGQQFRIRNVNTVSEVQGVNAADFAPETRVRAGSIYSPEAIDVTITRMEAVALQKGLNFIAIEPRLTRDDANGLLDLTFVLTRGPRVFVERIDIEGNTATLDEVIRRQFRTVEGDPLNAREIRNAAARIRALGYFADAQVDARDGTQPGNVIVDVNVEEQPTGSLTLGATYGAGSGLGFNIGLSEANFLGRGQQVDVQLSTAKSNNNSRLSFTEPYFLGRDLSAGFQIWYNTTDGDNALFKSKSFGFQPTLEFPLSARSRLSLRYRLASDEIYGMTAWGPDTGDKDGDGNKTENIGSSPILIAEQGRRTGSALGYTYTWDTKREELDPRTRFLVRFGQDFAGLGGDIKSVTTTALAVAERKVWGEDVTLRAELEGGAVHMLGDQNSRIIDRFRNYGKIRSFKPNGIGPRDTVTGEALGGNYFAVLRTEIEFPIGLPEEYGVHGGVFADVGTIWGLNNTAGVTAVDDSRQIRASAGVSLFWETPIGPLRMNYGKALKKQDYDEEQRFELTVTTRF
ncbi:outer membrane protein assembly factor BamA [Paracoccus sp. p4-l81]|uniref:outer membrane protein assembly factor BamA n=1 Tax=unclassified Paracoccus (in: a-proteobacteria) TaxID=2688777 RepID=UPI0035B91FD5